jgi:predicted transcriptional regulator
VLRTRTYDGPVITASALRDRRLRAGYTSQAALAAALGVSERTVTAWEAEGSQVSARGEAKVRALLWPERAEMREADLRAASDTALIAELARRLAVRDEGRGNTTGTAGSETDPPQTTKVDKANTSARGTAGPHSPPRRSAR